MAVLIKSDCVQEELTAIKSELDFMKNGVSEIYNFRANDTQIENNLNNCITNFIQSYYNGDTNNRRIGEKCGVSKQYINENIKRKKFERFFNDKINKRFYKELNEEYFSKGIKIIKIDEEIVNELTEYKTFINEFWLNMQGDRGFNIDLDLKFVYSSDIEPYKLYAHFLNYLKDGNVYTYNELNNYYKQSLIDLDYMPDNNRVETLNLGIDVLNYEKDKSGKEIIHFIQLSEDEFLYSQKNLFKKDIRDAQMLYWFKMLYPNGVQLSQPNIVVLGAERAKEVEISALERLEKLFNKVPELRNITYRTLLRIISENSDTIKCYVDENIGYKSQRNFYIHKDNWDNRKTDI